MSTELEVTCVEKSNRISPYKPIICIGGKYSGGISWKKNLMEAISDIRSGKYSFFVMVNSVRTEVMIATSKDGSEYLTTENDGEENNNLLSLDRCK